jgi:hypothetical protein
MPFHDRLPDLSEHRPPQSVAWYTLQYYDHFPGINPLSSIGVVAVDSALTLQNLQNQYIESLSSSSTGDILPKESDLNAITIHVDVTDSFMRGVSDYVRKGDRNIYPYVRFYDAVNDTRKRSAKDIRNGWFGEGKISQIALVNYLTFLMLDEAPLHVDYASSLN